MEEESARRGLGVDTVRQAPEMYVPRFKPIHKIHEALDAAPQAIELPDHQRVPSTQMGKRLVETGSSRPSTAGFFREDTLAAGLLEGIELQGQILVLGRDPGIPDR